MQSWYAEDYAWDGAKSCLVKWTEIDAQIRDGGNVEVNFSGFTFCGNRFESRTMTAVPSNPVCEKCLAASRPEGKP